MAAAAKKSAKKAATKTSAAKTAKPAPAMAEPAPTHTPAAAPVAAAGGIGFFDVATVEKSPWGILALILNIIPGGVGTIIAGAKASATNQIIKGIVQFLFTWTFVVWIWSIVDGVRMFKRAT